VGGGDSSVLIHSKEIMLGVLLMYLVEGFHCFQACCPGKIVTEHLIVLVHWQEAANWNCFLFWLCIGC
jgi:hypothetical protein